MKAAELRIGNWVNLYGDDCRIQTVGMWVHTDTTVDEAPIESVKPGMLNIIAMAIIANLGQE